VGEVRPGHDLVVAAPPAVAGLLPAGTLLDDHLTPEARVAIEAEARRRAEVWVTSRRDGLRVDGIDLAWVWAVEVYRQAALPAVRLVRGLQTAADSVPVECPELDGPEAAALAEAGLELRGAGADATRSNGQPLTDGGAVSIPKDAARMSRLKRLAIQARVPVPQLVRGSVRVFDFWMLDPLVRALSADGRLLPVLDPGLLPNLPVSELVALGLRGGWIGIPGPVRRGRSERLLQTSVRALGPDGGDALDRLVDSRARALLLDRAQATISLVDRQRRAFAHGRIRLLVVPFDSIAHVRMVLVAAREQGVPSLLVQHGMTGEPEDPDMRESDHIAVWHERQAQRVVRTGRPATVTGNPAAPPARAARRSSSGAGRTLLLVQPVSPFSLRGDARLSQRSLEVGLAAVAAARPGGTVVVRPHPLDPDPDAHARSVPGLRVLLDHSSSIDELLSTCDLCIGGMSTAMLQAAAAGVPVVFLDISGMPPAWPFDRTTEVPFARGVDELAEQLQRAIAAPDVLGGDALAEALGVRPGALDQLVELAVGLAKH
jgi:hypothetical protein